MKVPLLMGALTCAFFFAGARRLVTRLPRRSQAKAGHSSLVTVCALFVSAANLFAQGSLTPPGAPAPTMKTLDQVKPGIPIETLPYTINAAGSYYLTRNLTGATGISVTASNVTIDLSGFTITGPGKNAGTGAIGISGAAATIVTVRNGKILQFPSDGIRLAAVAVIEDIVVDQCGGMGINAGEQSRVERSRAGATGDIGVNVGDSSVVNSCIVIVATNFGIKAGFSCQISQSISNYNSGPGIFAANNAVLRDCAAAYNTSGGGILAGVQSALHNCVAYSNTGGFGIEANGGSTLTNCTAAFNTGSIAIYTTFACTLNNCSAVGNTGTHGIYVESGYGTLTNCSSYSNTVTYGIYVTRSTMHNCVAAGNIGPVTSSYGIYASFSSVITNCSAYNNGNTSGTVTPDAGVGIYASASTVKDCTCGVNKGDGIQVVNNSVVEGNNSYLNGNGGDGAGIHATAFANRIESNNLVSNDRGIDVDAGGNLIIKNSARSNTNNYDIAADNRYGPIVDLTAAGTAAATGNNAPGTTVNPDPQANFAY
jgi:hypothetical protein